MELYWRLCVVVAFMVFSRVHTTGDEPFQEERLFENLCENCTISNGLGFAPDPYSCNCYYTCVLRESYKLATYADPWVSYLRCCPCHMTYSSKLLTCVDYTDKRSDCYYSRLPFDTNECSGQTSGDEILRQDPNSASGDSFMCSGYNLCTEVGGDLVPDPKCCPSGQCFDGTECSSEACSEVARCEALRETDDCECKQADAPERECAFVSMTNIFKFMGRENMKVYDCAPGTCWDQDTCTCVRTNNTGYDACTAFAQLDFDGNDQTARDSLGNTIWTELTGDAEISGEVAEIESGGYVSISGLANTYLSNKFILHFFFEQDVLGETAQCLLGSCQERESYPVGSRFYITMGADAEDLTVSFAYKDREYWIPGSDTTERFTLELSEEFGTQGYDFWMFYGWEEQVTIGLIGEDASVEAASTSVTGTVHLLPPESGFVFGECDEGSDFDGIIDNVEMYRGCKPFGNGAFDDAFEEINDALSGGE